MTCHIINHQTNQPGERLTGRQARVVPKATTCGVAALFVRRDSIYKDLGCDCYDIDRDARTYPGGKPIIAHPPCRTWGTLKAFAKPPAHEHDMALWAVAQLRIWGGALEHPASSDLWREAALPYPDGLPDEWGGWTLECDQFHWGHLARKRTRLYIVGVKRADMPPLPWRDGEPSHCVSSLSGKRRTRDERVRMATFKPELGPNRRDKTPTAFATWLLEVAENADKKFR
jgi:hypothetical protein